MEQEKVHPGDGIAVIDGVVVLRCAADGPLLDGERAALDLVGDALGRAELVVVPVGRIAPAFFALASGVAGASCRSSSTTGSGWRLSAT